MAVVQGTKATSGELEHQLLRDMCTEIWAHLYEGAPAPSWFNPAAGLCINAAEYAESVDFPFTRLVSYLYFLFEDRPNPNLPFNVSYKQYWQERYLGSVYLNPRRLNFIEQMRNK